MSNYWGKKVVIYATTKTDMVLEYEGVYDTEIGNFIVLKNAKVKHFGINKTITEDETIFVNPKCIISIQFKN